MQKPGTCGFLSAWLRPMVQAHSTFGEANASLANFFRTQQANAAERAQYDSRTRVLPDLWPAACPATACATLPEQPACLAEPASGTDLIDIGCWL